jgi:hypothetical protein
MKALVSANVARGAKVIKNRTTAPRHPRPVNTYSYRDMLLGLKN